MKKIITAFLTSLVLTVSFLVAIPPSTIGVTWNWNESWGGWVDSRCGPNEAFNVNLYENSNGGGAKTKVCGYWPKFCTIPMETGYYSNCGLYEKTNPNDVVSSIYIAYLPTGCQLWFWFDEYYGGTGNSYSTRYLYLNFPEPENDDYSSLKRTC